MNIDNILVVVVFLLIQLNSVRSCKNVFNGRNGSIVSAKPCKYEIRTTIGHWIHLKWLSFYVYDTTLECQKDYVDVKIGCNNPKTFSRICNFKKDEVPHDFYSIDECMTIEYVQKGNKNPGNGFSAVYSIKSNQEKALPYGCSPGSLSGSGILKSPNWPNPYHKQVSDDGCVWTFTFKDHDNLQIVFMNMDLFTGNIVSQCGIHELVWPDDFKWSYSGRIPGYDCLQIIEGSEPIAHSWNDNYFCSKHSIGMKWSMRGPIKDLRCTKILERSDPHTWSDNYLCVPNHSSFRFSWSSSGPIKNRTCIQWNEPRDPHTWDDNYLCTGVPVHHKGEVQQTWLFGLGGFIGFSFLCWLCSQCKGNQQNRPAAPRPCPAPRHPPPASHTPPNATAAQPSQADLDEAIPADPSSTTYALQGATNVPLNENAELPESVEKRFSAFKPDGNLNPLLKVMGGYDGLPKSNGVGKMVIETINQTQASQCNQVITWCNTLGRKGPFQWLGWQDRTFANKIITYRFWIKFVDRVPQKSSNFGMKVYGTVYNDFVDSCLPNKWCEVKKTVTCGSCGDGNHVILIFDSIDHHQTVHISQFTVDQLQEGATIDPFRQSSSICESANRKEVEIIQIHPTFLDSLDPPPSYEEVIGMSSFDIQPYSSVNNSYE